MSTHVRSSIEDLLFDLISRGYYPDHTLATTGPGLSLLPGALTLDRGQWVGNHAPLGWVQVGL